METSVETHECLPTACDVRRLRVRRVADDPRGGMHVGGFPWITTGAKFRSGNVSPVEWIYLYDRGCKYCKMKAPKGFVTVDLLMYAWVQLFLTVKSRSTEKELRSSRYLLSHVRYRKKEKKIGWCLHSPWEWCIVGAFLYSMHAWAQLFLTVKSPSTEKKLPNVSCPMRTIQTVFFRLIPI